MFCEKPLAETVEEAQSIVDAARANGRKLVIGYILRVHPAWIRFIEIARTLGKPLVMRMNLNQQSHGPTWNVHRNLMKSMSPIVDCGVHYVDVMCQMTGAKPVRVSAVGARLTDELKPGMYNYGQLRSRSTRVGGLVRGGLGADDERDGVLREGRDRPQGLRLDRQGSERSDAPAAPTTSTATRRRTASGCTTATSTRTTSSCSRDELINTEDEPDHQGLCDREQAFLLRAIQQDLDLTDHMQDAVNSLRIVLAADESVRTGKIVQL